MTPLERRYRRTLRLLPAGYRQMWEDDMVDAYMESASHHDGDASSQRSLAEHLSVLGLAVRLRLAGAHASPRGLAWRGAVHGFALVALLYLALGSIVSATTVVIESLHSLAPPTTAVLVRYWSFGVPAVLWVAAFIALVLGRASTTRVLVLLAFVSEIGFMVNSLVSEVRPMAQQYGLTPGGSLVWRQPIELDVAHGLWLAIITVATLVAARPGSSKPGRWLWLGGGAALGLILAVAVVQPGRLPYGYVRLEVAVHLGLVAAMVAALALRRTPRWLLALGLFVLVFAGGELLDYLRYILDGRSVGQEYFSPLSYMQRFDIGLMALAVACVVVGLIELRRLPRVQHSATKA